MDFCDICFSNGRYKENQDYHLHLIVSSPQEAIEKLKMVEQLLLETDSESLPETPKKIAGISFGKTAEKANKIAFVFTGMGVQWSKMGQELLQYQPIFRDVIERCTQEFQKHSSNNIQQMLDTEPARMQEPEIAQPTNLAIQLGLCEILKNLGIIPDAIVGHSAGEVAAFYQAGVLSFSDAMRVIYARSHLQQRTLGQGKMLVLGVSLQYAQTLIEPYPQESVSLAAVNSPQLIALAGREAILQEIMEKLPKGTFSRFLDVNVPYHSDAMSPLKGELLTYLDCITPQSETIPIYSTVTGKKIHGTEIDSLYWYRNIREPVYFASAIEQMIQDGIRIFIQIGPKNAVGSAISDMLSQHNLPVYVFTSMQDHQEWSALLHLLGEMNNLGYSIPWEKLYPHAQRTVLPRYEVAWQKSSHWIEPVEMKRIRMHTLDHPLLGMRLSNPVPTWQRELNPHQCAYLQDHQIQDKMIFPAAGYVEMMLAALRQTFGMANYSLSNLAFEKALFLASSNYPDMQTTLDMQAKSIQIHANHDVHAKGYVQSIQKQTSLQKLEPVCLPQPICWPKEKFYTALAANGFQYGPQFQSIQSIEMDDTHIKSFVHLQENLDTKQYLVHPVVLDACLQTMIGFFLQQPTFAMQLPTAIQQFTVYPSYISKSFCVQTNIKSHHAEETISDIVAYDEHQNIILSLQGCVTRAMQAKEGIAYHPKKEWFYEIEWVQKVWEATHHPIATGTWLILADHQGIGQQLAQKIEKAGGHCILVFTAEEYSHHDNIFTIRPSCKEDYKKLYDACQPTLYQGIVHLWNLETSNDNLTQAEVWGCLSLIYLLQTLDAEQNFKLWIMTRGVQAIAGDSHDISVAQSPAWGLARVIGQQEFSRHWGGIIDLSFTPFPQECDMIAQEILQPSQEDQIAFRNSQRYVARLERSKNLTVPLPLQFKQQSAYIITGALGSIGQSFCHWMVQHSAKFLILLHRTTQDFVWWGNTPPENLCEQRHNFIQTLQNLGVQLCHVALDIGNPQHIQNLLQQYHQKFHAPIQGFFHIAGVIEDVTIANMTLESFHHVFYPKAIAAWHWHKALSKEPLDFFVLFSSIGSILTATGQANYAAANALLDSLSWQRKRENLPSHSLNWGPWMIGMVQERGLVQHFQHLGMDCFDAQGGVDALDWVLGQEVRQTGIFSIQWYKTLASYPAIPLFFSNLETKATSDHDTDHLFEQLKKLPDEQRRNLVITYLKKIISCILNIDHLCSDTLLGDIGMESRTTVELRQLLNEHFHVRLSGIQWFQQYSTEQLATLILQELKTAVFLETAPQPLQQPKAAQPVLNCSLAEMQDLFQKL